MHLMVAGRIRASCAGSPTQSSDNLVEIWLHRMITPVVGRATKLRDTGADCGIAAWRKGGAR
jgi:hypothetical protein